MTPHRLPTMRQLPLQGTPIGLAAVVDDCFDAHGETTAAGGDRPFLLHGPSAWLVREGAVDVFAVDVAEGRAAGPRAHICRVEAGRALFGLAPVERGRGLVAVGSAGTRVTRVPGVALRAWATEPAREAELFGLVDGWVEALCAGIAGDVAPRRCTELEPGAEVALAERTTARPRRGVSWVRHVEGHSLLLGREGLTVNGSGFTPLSRRAWMQATTPSRVVLVDAAALPDPDELWTGLDRLHALVVAYSTMLAAQGAAADGERLRRRRAASRAALAGACADLASAMRPGRAGVAGERADGATAAAPTSHDALLAAAQLVGDALGVQVKGAAVPEGTVLRDPVATLARASRLRWRKVALRDAWWTADHGPLLGAVADDGRAVALLPARRGGYVAHDPLRRTVAPVDAALAETLAPFAHTFYRPFPEHPLGIADVVRTGFRGCGRDLATVAGMGALAALLGLVPSMATGMLFNTIIPGAQRSQLVAVAIVLVVCALATGLFNVTRSIALLRLEGRMSATIQAAVWDRLLSLPMPFFRPYAAGDLAVRAMGIDAIRQVISGTTITAILGGVFSLFNFGLMFHYSPTMAWRATLLIVVAIGATALGSWLQLSHQREIATIQSKASGLVLQLLSSITKLRVAGAEPTAFALWAEKFTAQRRLQFRARQIGIWVTTFNAAFPLVAYVVLFWSALPLVRNPEAGLRTGDFLAFLAAYGASQGALLATSMALLSTLAVIPLYEQAKPILQSVPEVDRGKSDPGVLSGAIEIQHAGFRYQPDGPPVLRDVSLHVRPGEFVAFVGPSGSGKSTILRLLLGFETLEAGAIYYDGQEIGGLDIQQVRRQIGVVLQNGKLMSGDVFTNIVGSAPLTMDDAWEAARMAGFADDVKSMPMGMHTVISEGGGTLSGGQRQRLMIARALVHRPRLLFFDEATSALDNRTQAIVSRSLEQLQATRIVVAHRLSTIVNADRIVVIERGQIVQSGRYEELLLQPGLFAELAARQLA